MYPSGFPHIPTPIYGYPYWPAIVELPPGQSLAPTSPPVVGGSHARHARDVIVATNCVQCMKEQEMSIQGKIPHADCHEKVEDSVKSSDLKFGIQRILSGKTVTKEESTKGSDVNRVMGSTSSSYGPQSTSPCCTTTCCVLYAPLPYSPSTSQHLRPYDTTSVDHTDLSSYIHDHSSTQTKRKRSWSRAVFSNLQRKGLEKRFEIQKYVTKPDRRQLAAMLGLTDAQVKVWFQNRRMKWRHSKESEKLYDIKHSVEKDDSLNKS